MHYASLGALLRDIDSKIAGIRQCHALGTTLNMQYHRACNELSSYIFCLAEDPVAAKMLSYNRANRAVAILCNHQRAAPKNFSKQMENLMAKVSHAPFFRHL